MGCWGSKTSQTNGYEDPRSVYKSIVLNLHQPQLQNAIQHLLWVLNYLPQCLPEQPFHQYEGGPRREEVQQLQQIFGTFLLLTVRTELIEMNCYIQSFEDFTYGITITWEEPYLQKLILFLVDNMVNFYG
jgi:hypothetical protein